MRLNIDYEKALDFEHIEDMNTARMKLSELTTLLNQAIMDRQTAKKAILEACANHPEEVFSKMSWDNKIQRLMEIEDRKLVDDWSWTDTAYRQIRNKQAQVIEDIMALKKMIEVTPR